MKNILEKYKIYGLKIFIRFSINEIKKILWDRIVRKSYSMDGEDLIIDKILGYRRKGFYIDVGAYDPISDSNTKRFYDRGWLGINIEPNREKYNKFILCRKRDINLNIGIGEKNSKMKFYRFFPDTISTFSQKEVLINKRSGYKYLGEEIISVKKLSNVLSQYCSKRAVDFLSIDTEGYDLKVLKSNNWRIFKPKIICVETRENFGFKDVKTSKVKGSKINRYLISKGYQKVVDIGINSIYKYKYES